MDQTIGFICNMNVMPLLFEGKDTEEEKLGEEKFYNQIRKRISELIHIESDKTINPFNDEKAFLIADVDFNFYISGQDYRLISSVPCNFTCSIFNCTWGATDYFLYRSDRSICNVVMREDQITDIIITSRRVLGYEMLGMEDSDLSIYLSPLYNGKYNVENQEISKGIDSVFESLKMNGDMMIEMIDDKNDSFKSQVTLVSKYVGCFESTYFMWPLEGNTPILIFKNKLEAVTQTKININSFLKWYDLQIIHIRKYFDIYESVRSNNYILKTCYDLWNMPSTRDSQK